MEAVAEQVVCSGSGGSGRAGVPGGALAVAQVPRLGGHVLAGLLLLAGGGSRGLAVVGVVLLASQRARLWGAVRRVLPGVWWGWGWGWGARLSWCAGRQRLASAVHSLDTVPGC